MRWLFILVISILVSEVNAQTNKGVYMIGGSMSFQRDAFVYASPTATDDPTSTITVNPNVGYFFMNNLMTGIELSYKHAWTSNSYKNNIYGAGPVVRYYFPIGEKKKFAVFPEGALQFQASKLRGVSFDTQTRELIPYEMNLRMNTYRAAVGAVWFPVRNIGVEGIFGYSLTKYAKNFANFNKASATYLRIGIQFYIHNN